MSNLNFHQTFRPERQYISSLLRSLESCCSKNISEISSITGIPTGKSSGKVEPTICYAEYMGLINSDNNNGRQFSFTSMGRIVKEEDCGMLEKLTLLLMHCMLVRPYTGAELWSYIFHNVFPKYRNELSVKQFEGELNIRFGEKINISPFRSSYQDLFGSLGLISSNEDRITLNASKIDNDFVYLYAFIFYTYWNEWLINTNPEGLCSASKIEINANHLKTIGFKNSFGWNENEEYKALETMEGKNIIAINKQMVPFSIRRVADLDTIVENLYSELI